MAEKPFQHIRFDLAANGVATIRFALPEVANALDQQGVEELLAALHRCEDDDARVVVLTGAGDKAFCAGFHLKEIPLSSPDVEALAAHFRVLARWWHQVLHRIVRIPKPVVAAVNGVAAGVGLGMVLAADLAVAVESATFLCAWHAIGLANDAASSYTLARIVGLRRATELMMTNRTLSATEACEWQIVNRVYPPADFERNVATFVADLAAGPTHLQAMAKERFHAGWRQSIEECTELEIQNVMRSVRHAHFRPVLERFLKKETRGDTVQARLP